MSYLNIYFELLPQQVQVPKPPIPKEEKKSHDWDLPDLPDVRSLTIRSLWVSERPTKYKTLDTDIITEEDRVGHSVVTSTTYSSLNQDPALRTVSPVLRLLTPTCLATGICSHSTKSSVVRLCHFSRWKGNPSLLVPNSRTDLPRSPVTYNTLVPQRGRSRVLPHKTSYFFTTPYMDGISSLCGHSYLWCITEKRVLLPVF